MAVARSRIETKDEIVSRVKKALEFIDKDQLILAPDCGLGFLTPEIIKEKLQNMVSAAKEF